MSIDTHVHLQHKKYQPDFDKVLQRAAKSGVTKAIIPGTTLDDSRLAVKLAADYSSGPCQLYAAVGIHPTGTDEFTPAALRELRTLAQHPRVVAIGEIGLDYYWPKQTNRNWTCASPARQRKAFEMHLELASELNLPVIVHDREAHADTLRILRQWIKNGATQNGTLHAYAGGIEMLEETLALGFYIGMDGPVTFKKAAELHAVAKQVPLERLLLETDGPYLTPEPYRGKRNQPAYLIYVAQRIAELRRKSAKEIDIVTTENAERLFSKLGSSSDIK